MSPVEFSVMVGLVNLTNLVQSKQFYFIIYLFLKIQKSVLRNQEKLFKIN